MRVRDIVRSALRPLGLDLVRAHTTMEGHLARLLASLGVNVVFDVGAHYGEYASLLRQIGYRGRIVSFEPVTENYDRLVHARRRDRSWIGVPIALGAERDARAINVTAPTDLCSFRTPSARATAWGLPARIVRQETTAVERLGDVLGSCIADVDNPRVFLKMDTQGSDWSVPQGAQGSLDVIVGLQTEVASQALYDGVPLFPEALRPILDLGYEVTDLFAVARPDGIAAIEYDCFLRRT